MDLLFLPQTMQKDKRSNTQMSFRSYSLPLPSSYQYSGFYYIGKKSAQIEKLVQMYKRGYASEGLENVKNELLMSLERENNVLPEVIVCEARFEYAAIQGFKKFLSG